MPINIQNDLPAYRELVNENIFVMTKSEALKQDIRPLKIAILNLMPKKIETETQLLRLLSNSPLQVDIDLVATESYQSHNTSPDHLLKFYTNFSEISNNRYDGFIITGAPVEQMAFEEVNYWQELREIMDWTKTNVWSTLHICWGAQAGLYHHYGIDKHPLKQKCFGVFPHHVICPSDPLLKGFDEVFQVPHSRHTSILADDIKKSPVLSILTESPQAGVHIVGIPSGRQYFITGHSEYDRNTLATEYFRDREKGLQIPLPENYFPENNDRKTPMFTWSAHANLLFFNWLNYCVYQKTPYDLRTLSEGVLI